MNRVSTNPKCAYSFFKSDANTMSSACEQYAWMYKHWKITLKCKTSLHVYTSICIVYRDMHYLKHAYTCICMVYRIPAGGQDSRCRISHRNIIFHRTSQFRPWQHVTPLHQRQGLWPLPSTSLLRSTFTFIHITIYNSSNIQTLASSRLRGEDSTPSVVELLHAWRVFARRGNFNFHLLLTPHALGAGECYSRICCMQSPPFSIRQSSLMDRAGTHHRRTGPTIYVHLYLEFNLEVY